MADVPKQCAFCKKGEDAERLDRVSKDILAHHNCMLFSPQVTSASQQDPQDNEFNIASVISEIKRGIKLRCGICKKGGATVGCDHKECKRQFHYPCVTEAKGRIIRDEEKEQYIVYCRDHANSTQLSEDTETTGTFKTSASSKKPRKNNRQKKRKKKMEHGTARKKKSFGGKPESGTVQNAEMCLNSDDEQRASHQLLNNHIDEEDMEVPGPSRTNLDNTTSSISKDSSGSRTPQILRTISLSGFPKINRKRKRNKNNPELETALLSMHSDEREAISQLYDEVGGSFPMFEDICEVQDEHMEDTSGTVEDISKDQHIGTKARSDRLNPKIATLESSVSIRTPEGPCASSTTVHDATSVSQLPGHFPSVTSSPSRQLINVNNKVKRTDSLQGTTFNTLKVVIGIEKLASTNGEMLKSADSTDGVSNARAQPKDICNGKDKFVSISAVYHKPTKPLDDHPLGPSSTNKASGQQQLMNSPNNNISSEEHKKNTKNKDLVLASLGKTLKKHASQFCSNHAPSKTLGSANTDILLNKEPLNSPSLSKTSNEQPMNLQFTSKSTEDQCKQSPGVSKSLGEQSTRNVHTTKALVHAVNSHDFNVPVDQMATVLKKQSQPVVHLLPITTGTELLNWQPSYSSLVDSKCTEIAASSPTGKEAFLEKELLRKKAHASREDVKQLKQDDLVAEQSPEHSIISQQVQNYLSNVDENLGTSGGATSGQTSEHCIISQQTQKYLSSVDGDLRNSGFPANAGKLMNLGIDQKSKLMESYKEAEKQMSRTGDRTKAAQAFWDLCRDNKCREFLLTSVTCYMTSVFHIIVHKAPKDRDFEQAFAFLQASGRFANFMSGTEGDQAKISSRTTRETYNESDSDSVGSCTEVEDQGEITRDEDPDDDIQSELCESCSESSSKKQSTEGDDLDRMEIDSPAASLVSPSVSRESDLILPENASRRHRALEDIQLKTMKTNLRVVNSQLQTLQYQLQHQTEDGDAGFATNLIQFLRKVPEDKKLSTQMSILNVLSSVLAQQPMSISTPSYVP
ncbi:uncharacterized protein LOC120929095 isoform X2 [Rana temporaria]|uniref:uncharacterized protein LOC120929095 isoform X2 n=1 Tax=Rana temporaria TaxID=8407 RepID=UPI001AAD6AAD|nr:uncharacterized protein LOC120929095 isoform X2 [Rana temporaria]